MTKEIPVLNLEGERITSISVEIPDFKPNMDVIHRYVVAFLANQRQGTSSAKTRAEVSGFGKETVETKGDRKSKGWFNTNTPVATRRGGVRTETKGLQKGYSRKDERYCIEGYHENISQ